MDDFSTWPLEKLSLYAPRVWRIFECFVRDADAKRAKRARKRYAAIMAEIRKRRQKAA